MSNLVERTRTIDRWIRFLNLNRPLGDWGEPAPRVSPPAVPLTPFCQGHTLSYIEGFNASVLIRRRDTLDTKVLQYLRVFLCNIEIKLKIALFVLMFLLFTTCTFKLYMFDYYGKMEKEKKFKKRVSYYLKYYASRNIFCLFNNFNYSIVVFINMI